MSEAFRATGADWPQEHLESYLRTDGAVGHVVDFSGIGSPIEAPCLILEVVGRKSGKRLLVPLIYGRRGEDFVIVASKGGAAEDPAWFRNLAAHEGVKFQVGAAKYRGRARVAESPEREALYAMMATICPPYLEYEKMTARKIPVVVLEVEGEIDAL